MSQENVQIVIDGVAAYNRGDLDALSEQWTDDIDHRAAEGAIDDRGPIHGKDAMRAYLQDWLQTFDPPTVQPLEVIDAGENRVVAVLRFAGRAKLSRVDTELTYAVVYTVRDGKIARGREYMTREEALEAAGLSE